MNAELPPHEPPVQPPARPHTRIWHWYRRQRAISKIGIGCALLLLVTLTCCISSIAIFGPTIKQSDATYTLTTGKPTPTVATTTHITSKHYIPPTQPTPIQQPTPIFTPRVIVVPSPIPTPTPTGLSTTGNTLPVLGAALTTFETRYGQPDPHTDTKSGSYHFQQYTDSNIDYLIAWTDLADGGAYTQRVYSLGVQADTGGWSKDKGDTICAGFRPPDAVYKRRVTLTSGSDGYDEIYASASLASLFPASAFTDANTNSVKPGLFDVQYLINQDGTIGSCTLQLGTQQTQ